MKSCKDWYKQKLIKDMAFYYYDYKEILRIYSKENDVSVSGLSKQEFKRIRREFKKSDFYKSELLEKFFAKLFTKYVKICLISYVVVQIVLITTALVLGVEKIDDKGVIFSEISMLLTFPICMLLFMVFPPFLASGDDYWEIFLLIFLVPLGAVQYFIIGKWIDYSIE